MSWRVAGCLLLLLLAACASTPEDQSTTPVGVDVIPGCEHARSPEECRREHKSNGSDVPTVDHHSPASP